MTKSAEAELKNSATPGMILPGSSQNTRSAGGHSQSASVKLEAMSCCGCVRVPTWIAERGNNVTDAWTHGGGVALASCCQCG